MSSFTNQHSGTTRQIYNIMQIARLKTIQEIESNQLRVIHTIGESASSISFVDMAFRELPFRLDRVNGSIGLDVDQQAVVTRIVPGGPADGKIQVGVVISIPHGFIHASQVGDRMVRIFGEAVQSGPHFNSLLISRQVNPVTLSVFRKEERREGKDGARPGFEFKVSHR